MVERPEASTSDGGWVLGIDTSSEIVSLALMPLSDDGVFGAELAWPAGRNQTATLLAQVDHLCRLCQIQSDAFGAVVVATGPGGFNALRAGMSVAKGFAFALGIPILGVGTLDLAAFAVSQSGLPVRAFVPAGRGRVVYADYRYLNGRLLQQGEVAHRRPEDLAADLMTPTVLVGDLAPGQAEALSREENVVLPGPGTRRRRAAVMIELALPRLRAGESDDLTTLEPLYLHYQKTESMTGSESRA